MRTVLPFRQHFHPCASTRQMTSVSLSASAESLCTFPLVPSHAPGGRRRHPPVALTSPYASSRLHLRAASVAPAPESCINQPSTVPADRVGARVALNGDVLQRWTGQGACAAASSRSSIRSIGATPHAPLRREGTACFSRALSLCCLYALSVASSLLRWRPPALSILSFPIFSLCCGDWGRVFSQHHPQLLCTFVRRPIERRSPRSRLTDITSFMHRRTPRALTDPCVQSPRPANQGRIVMSRNLLSPQRPASPQRQDRGNTVTAGGAGRVYTTDELLQAVCTCKCT